MGGMTYRLCEVGSPRLDPRVLERHLPRLCAVGNEVVQTEEGLYAQAEMAAPAPSVVMHASTRIADSPTEVSVESATAPRACRKAGVILYHTCGDACRRLPRRTMAGETAVAPWRTIVASSLDWHEAHATFDDAVAGLKPELRGRRSEHFPHSAWELLEHIRRAQSDLLAFMRDAGYSAPKWPDDYWPSEPAPIDARAWDESITAVRRDRAEIKGIATDSTLDLADKIPWGDGQTYLRTILLAADHSAYHVGQLIAVRRMLDAWPAA